MFSTPRQLASESALYDAAIKILMRRAYSVHEMKQALARRCEDESLVKRVMARLKTAGLIDDARWAGYPAAMSHLLTVLSVIRHFSVAKQSLALQIPFKYG